MIGKLRKTKRRPPPHLRLDVLDDGVRSSAKWAFVVAVFHQRDQRLVRTAHVIALGINRHRQVDDGLGGAEQGAGPQRFGQ